MSSSRTATRFRKHKRKKSDTVEITATVDFVNNRLAAIRSQQEEVLQIRDEDQFFGLLPGDEVVVKKFKSRRHHNYRDRDYVIELISVNRLKEHFVVGVVGAFNPNYADTYYLEPIGVKGLGIIDFVNCNVPPGQIVVVAIAPESTTNRTTNWNVLKIEKLLNDQCSVAVEVARCRFGYFRRSRVAESVEKFEAPETEVANQLQQRKDYRQLPFVTIDPESAHDFDDAIFCESIDDGFRLLVAIADVAHFVSPDCETDRLAAGYGTSTYFPRSADTMLPHQLTSEVCSLTEGKDRLAIICEVTIDREGKIVDFGFYDSVIRSSARLTFNQVANGLIQHLEKRVIQNLICLAELHRLLLARRESSVGMEIDLPEYVPKFDNKGDLLDFTKSESNAAHSLVEECMIVANVCAALFLDKHCDGTGIFRVHDAPSRSSAEEFNGILSSFKLTFPTDRAATLEDYAHIESRLRNNPQLKFALQIHTLRSMSTAVYSEARDAHFALNLEHYTHFTSPIRRYPDLIVHRMIKAVLSGSPAPYHKKQLANISAQSSYLERRADACVREAVKWLKAEFIKTRIGDTFEGVVIDVRHFGVFVQLNEPYIDGMISVSDLGPHWYDYDPYQRTLTEEFSGYQYKIGMKLEIVVVNVNTELGHIDFKIAHPYKKRPKRRARHRR